MKLKIFYETKPRQLSLMMNEYERFSQDSANIFGGKK